MFIMMIIVCQSWHHITPELRQISKRSLSWISKNFVKSNFSLKAYICETSFGNMLAIEMSGHQTVPRNILGKVIEFDHN